MTKKIRILFVDDDPMLLASTRRQLLRKMRDCDLAFFERATDAITDIQSCAPDIVLSDVRMPEMDGAEFLEKVAILCPGVVRLAWTGQSEPNQLVRVFDIAHQVFSKPCPTESLHRLIDSVAEFVRVYRASSAEDHLSGSELEKLQHILAEFKEHTIPPVIARQ